MTLSFRHWSVAEYHKHTVLGNVLPNISKVDVFIGKYRGGAVQGPPSYVWVHIGGARVNTFEQTGGTDQILHQCLRTGPAKGRLKTKMFHRALCDTVVLLAE